MSKLLGINQPKTNKILLNLFCYKSQHPKDYYFCKSLLKLTGVRTQKLLKIFSSINRELILCAVYRYFNYAFSIVSLKLLTQRQLYPYFSSAEKYTASSQPYTVADVAFHLLIIFPAAAGRGCVTKCTL